MIGPLPEQPRMHPDRGYNPRTTRDLLEILGHQAEIAAKGEPAPIPAGRRWPVERLHSWRNGYGKLRRVTDKRKDIVELYLYLAAALTVTRRLINQAQSPTSEAVVFRLNPQRSAASAALPSQARCGSRSSQESHPPPPPNPPAVRTRHRDR